MGGTFLWALQEIPLGDDREASPPSMLIQASDGTALGRAGALKLPDQPISAFPPHLIAAVLSIEDRRFHSHWGIDPRGILRALLSNVEAQQVVEGGSTITQQLVKIEFLTRERTMVRKLREAMLAIWLDYRLGKDAILARYLNRIYLGAGAHGVPAAARLYFDKTPAQLTVAQAAMLAGMIRAPSHYNPLRNLDAARGRTAVVITAMEEAGAIDAETARKARAVPVTLDPSDAASPAGSWFADWIAQRASVQIAQRGASTSVRTTLVPAIQTAAEDVLRRAIAREGKAGNVSQGALVAMRPDGSVVAMVGGRDYGESRYNRAVQARRQPGSAFKLFVYLAALRHGYATDSAISDAPLQVGNWRPENYGGHSLGSMSLTDAFARSANRAAVRLAMDVGLDKVIAAARDLGITSPLPKVPSLALGTAEVSLLELTGAYASVRSGRLPVRPWGIAAFGQAESSWSRPLGAPKGPARSLGSHQEPLVNMLRQVVESGTGTRAGLDGFAAGKTGTSQDHRDAWFIGFNEDLVVGVWVGNDNGEAMEGVTGGSLPASIWHDFMVRAAPHVGDDGKSEPAEPRPTLLVVAADEEAAPSCDVDTCSRAYRSFRASDCTYQPYSGPRQICQRGSGGIATMAALRAATEPNRAAMSGQCNIRECTAAYQSFDPADCSFQPYDGGPRRLCQR